MPSSVILVGLTTRRQIGCISLTSLPKSAIFSIGQARERAAELPGKRAANPATAA